MDHSITQWQGNKRGAVSLTFDDGYDDEVFIAAPALEARGLRGTFYLWTKYPTYRGTWEAWAAAARRGHEIGNHTMNHPDFSAIPAAEMRADIAGGKAEIEARIPFQRCLTFAYPNGRFSETAGAIVQDFHLAARGTAFGLNSTPYEFFNLKAMSDEPWQNHELSQMEVWTETAERQQQWMIVALHSLTGVGYGFWNPETFEKYLDYLATRNVWVAPLGSVVQYIRSRDSASISVISSAADRTMLGLTTSADPTIADGPLTVRSRVRAQSGAIRVEQNGAIVIVSPVIEGTETVVYYDAVPGSHPIALSPATATPPVTPTR